MRTNYSLKVLQIILTATSLLILWVALGAVSNLSATVANIISYIP